MQNFKIISKLFNETPKALTYLLSFMTSYLQTTPLYSLLLQQYLNMKIQEYQLEQVYFDSHNHLLDYQQPQLNQIITQAITKNVLFCTTNTTRQSQYEKLIHISNQYPINLVTKQQFQHSYYQTFLANKSFQILPSFGIHPCFIQYEANNAGWKQNLQKVIMQNPLYAIGEIGIDYRKDILQKNSKDDQHKFFIEQLQMSFLYDRPVTVHCVRAHGELLKMFKKYNKLFEMKGQSQKGKTQGKKQQQKGQRQGKLLEKYRKNAIIMHSYGGAKEITTSLLKLNNLNLYFSLSLKRSEDLCNVIPLDKLLIQTDAPYQNNMPLLQQFNLLSQKNMPSLQLQQQRQHQENNRIANVRVNVLSLCKYYNTSEAAFCYKILQNSLRAFKLLA